MSLNFCFLDRMQYSVVTIFVPLKIVLIALVKFTHILLTFLSILVEVLLILKIVLNITPLIWFFIFHLQTIMVSNSFVYKIDLWDFLLFQYLKAISFFLLPIQNFPQIKVIQELFHLDSNFWQIHLVIPHCQFLSLKPSLKGSYHLKFSG